jgi:hypothetical protein
LRAAGSTQRPDLRPRLRRRSCLTVNVMTHLFVSDVIRSLPAELLAHEITASYVLEYDRTELDSQSVLPQGVP